GRYARQLSYTLHNLEHQPTRIGRRLLNQTEIELTDEIAGRDKARIKPGGFNGAAEEQSRSKKQHKRERYLCHDRNMTRCEEATQTPDARRLADLLFKVINEIGLCCFPCRSETEKHCCDEAKEKCDC